MFHTIKRLLKYAKPWRGTMILTVLVLIVGSLFNLVTPAIVGRITDILSRSASDAEKSVIILAVILAAAYILRGICRFLALWQAHVAAWNYVPSLTLQVYDHIQNLTPRWYGENRTGDIMSRVINDTRALETLIAHTMPDLISNFVIVAGVAVMICIINPLLAVIALLPVPLVIYASTFYSKTVSPFFKANQRFLGVLSGSLQDRIAGMKEIQAFSAAGREHVKMKELCREYTRLNVRANFANGIYTPIVEFLTSLGTVLVAGIGGVLALRGQLSAADIVAFFMYLSLFYTPLTTLARLAEDVQTAVAAGERVLQVLDEQPDIVESADAADIGTVRGELEFRHVSFAYGEDKSSVLQDISFRAKPGTMTAIVGTTGAGKTTMISLIERFYDTTGGTILIDGHDIRDLTFDCLRSNLSVVLQDIFLFNGTILENIRYGAPQASDDAVIAAAKAACADDFIRQMPDGYNTVVGERGTRLSGGQKQRISIARALLRDAPILILDEATSAVDNETEELIRQSMDNLCGKKTLLVIAHRLSTVRRADHILVIENGTVAESGTHEELLARNGLYSRLCQAQEDRLCH